MLTSRQIMFHILSFSNINNIQKHSVSLNDVFDVELFLDKQAWEDTPSASGSDMHESILEKFTRTTVETVVADAECVLEEGAKKLPKVQGNGQRHPRESATEHVDCFKKVWSCVSLFLEVKMKTGGQDSRFWPSRESHSKRRG